MGASFIVIIGLVSAVGTSLVYGIGGYLVIRHVFTIGTIVAFGAYLTSLYTSLQGLANDPVEFATSVVSFERVFEVIDLPLDIQEKADPIQLTDVRGELVFEDVSFHYDAHPANLLSEVQRFGQIDNVTAALSGGGPYGAEKQNGKGVPKGSRPRYKVWPRRWRRQRDAQPGSPASPGAHQLQRQARGTGCSGRSQRGRQDNDHLSNSALVRSG